MDRELGKEIFKFFSDHFLLGNSEFNAPNIELLIKEYHNLLIAALQIADSDIIDIKTKRKVIPLKSVNVSFPSSTATVSDEQKEMIQITSYHKASPSIPFNFILEESDGTKSLFLLLLSLFDIIRNNKILLIDELESHLHTSIVEFIIKLFYSSESAQLIFSTHNTKLLDLDKIRKDQIYFVNKKSNGSTDLYSLFDYKDFRDTMDVEKAYRQGRFDAVPFIDDSSANLQSLING
jgi:AAA15 family ATPase/GTPase